VKPQAASGATPNRARNWRRPDDIDDTARHDDDLFRRPTIERLDHSVVRQRGLFNLFLRGVLGDGDLGAAFAVDLDRQGDGVLDQHRLVRDGPGRFGDQALTALMGPDSSARCGVIGAISCASVMTASRCAAPPALDRASVLVKA
jgi:hypothetical protein